jgi:hypothetical protein
VANALARSSDLVWEAQDNATRAGVADRVQFLLQDLFETDLQPTTVVTLYLMESVNLQLRPKQPLTQP